MKTSLLSLLLLTLGFSSVAQDSTAFFSEPGDGGIIMKRYIDVDINGTDLQLSGDWTIESMLRMPPGFNLSQMHIVECYDQSTANGGFALRLSNQRVQAYAMSNGAQPNLVGVQIIPDDTWTHIAVTYNETTGIMSIYIDGILDNSTNLGSDQFTNVPTMRIGARGDDADVNQFSLIDEVRIWNIARDSADIVADMNACLTGTENGLLAYYTFENESGSSVTDQTPNGHDGTIINPLVQGNYQNGAYSCNDTASNEEIVKTEISVYPNPASHQLTIESNAPIVNADIVDLSGAIVQREVTSSFSIENLNAGMYFLHIATELGNQEIKFIKE